MFEDAKWICGADLRQWRHPLADHPFPAPYVIRDFLICSDVKSVILNICGLGQAAYFLNGTRIPDSIHPTHPCSYTKSIIYNTYDLTPLVEPGMNRLGAVLGHIHFADPEYMLHMPAPRMIAQLDITYSDGKKECIVSNSSFMVHDSPTLFSHRRCGERYDAKLEIPGWCIPGTSLDGWLPAYLCAGPGGLLRSTLCPPKRVFAELPGREIAPGLYDFGQNLSGWIRLQLHGAHYDPITVQYSEWLTDDKQHATASGLLPVPQASPEMFHKDVYLPAGRAEEQFEPLFSLHGFRYVQIEGAKDLTVTAIQSHTDLHCLSEFFCNDPTLNEIHKACERSILACAQGAMLDCPQREQNEWTGDAMLAAEVISMQYDAHDLFYEWMLKFKDDQLPSGYLPSVIPCRSNWHYNFANGLDWSSAIIHIPYYTMKYTGRSDIVCLMWENMVLAMDYFASRSESCLMNFGVGDWSALDARCNTEITDTVYYRLDAQMMGQMATALGKDPTRWMTLAEDIRKDFRKKYVRDGMLTDRSFTALICSVYGGMLEDEYIQTHVDAAAEIAKANGKALRCGVHGLRMVFDVFGTYGYNALLFEILTNNTVPGYAKAIKDGISTIPEHFYYRTAEDDTGCPSLNHYMNTTVEGWFFRYVAGIRCDGFGWENTVIAPQLLHCLPNFHCKVRNISVDRNGNSITVRSAFPFSLELAEHTGKYPAGTYTFRLR